MDKKIKVLLGLLAAASLLSIVLAVWTYFSAQNEVEKLTSQHAELEKESAYLQQSLDATQKETRLWQEKSEAISASLNRLDREYTLLQSMYDSLLNEKESLARENQNLSQKLEELNKLYARAKEKDDTERSDEFLASLLHEQAAFEVEIESLREKIRYLQTQAEPSRERIAELEQAEAAVGKRLEDIKKISDILSKNLLKEKKRRITLEEELARKQAQLRNINKEKDKLSEQLVRIKEALEQEPARLSRIKEGLASIELAPIVVKAEEAPLPRTEEAPLPRTEEAPSRPARLAQKGVELAGRIITVNDRHKFVVIDIGKEDGVKEAMSFDVYRNDERIGRIEAIETRKNISACDIKQISVRRLKVGDSVRR